MPSMSMGNLRARFRISEVSVLPFQVLNHGPPPVSNAAILLVTSNTLCNFPKNVGNHENAPKDDIMVNRITSKLLAFNWSEFQTEPSAPKLNIYIHQKNKVDYDIEGRYVMF